MLEKTTTKNVKKTKGKKIGVMVREGDRKL
jgi:hypothetical protein